MAIGSLALSGAIKENWWRWHCKGQALSRGASRHAIAFDPTDLVVLIFVELFGLRSAPGCPSVVMMGFKSCPFLLFFPALPLVALFAAMATCLALFMAAFLISFPFMIL